MKKQVSQGQLISLDQAVRFAVRADIAGVGGGVMPIDDTDGYHNEISGIYLPPWGGSDPGQPEPGAGDKREFLLRCKNTSTDGTRVEGFSIGSYVGMAEGHAGPGAPPNWQYAVDFAKKEVDARLKDMNGPQG